MPTVSSVFLKGSVRSKQSLLNQYDSENGTAYEAKASIVVQSSGGNMFVQFATMPAATRKIHLFKRDVQGSQASTARVLGYVTLLSRTQSVVVAWNSGVAYGDRVAPRTAEDCNLPSCQHPHSQTAALVMFKFC